MHLAI